MVNNQFELVPVDYLKPYDEQPECKRHVIGAYANLARHNMTVTINVIMQAIGMPLFNENDIDDAFNKSHRKKLAQLDNIQKVNLQKRLYRHFPFFKRMKLEDENKKSVQLNTLLEVMADFTNCMAIIRNFYTHYHPYNSPAELANQLELKKQMGKRLQYLFENTSQLFKNNESLPHEANEVFSALRIPEDYFEEITPKDNDYRKLYNFWNANPDKFEKQGNKFNQQTGVITRKKVKFVRNPEYQAYMMDDEKGMSDIAVIYFLCLFLEKKVSFELMEEVGLTEQIKFNGKNADQQLLFVKEILCMNRIRMTKTKLDSEMTDTALALDMINELRKCPKPLYEVFCKEARDEFKDDSTIQWEKEHGKETVETEDSTDNEGEMSAIKDTPRSTFVRWEDRFPQMALRYIDYQGIFKDIRFQLNLGKYRFAFYQHNKAYSVDNEERLRILQKELHGFGRIQEVEAKKNEKWAILYDKKYIEEGLTKKKPDEEGQAPYVTEQYAQYAIDEKSHSIGLRWEGWQPTGNPQKHYGDLDNLKMFIPYLPTKPLPEEKQTNQSESLLQPQALLSLYNLQGLIFYQYILKKYGKDKYEAEEVIKKSYHGMKKLLTDIGNGSFLPIEEEWISEEEWKEYTGKQRDERKLLLADKLKANGYNVEVNDICEKLRKYLLKISIDKDKKLKDSAYNRLKDREARIGRILESYRGSKKRIGSKENKFDRMRATIKTGSLAQALIRDIMDWLPLDSDAKTKLTGQSYMALQTAIAMLGQEFENGTGVKEEVTLANLKAMMIKAKVIDETVKSDNQLHFHPFLHLVIQDCTIESVEFLYELYLEKEIRYIQNIMKPLSLGNCNYRYIPFIHHERDRWKAPDAQAIQQLANRYLEKPLQLPDGLFNKKIFEILQSMEAENKEFQVLLKQASEEEPTNNLSNNASYLINLYFEHIEKDHSQHFYSTESIDGSPSPYRHIYRIFKKLYGVKSGRNQTTSPAYTIDELREKRKQAFVDVDIFSQKTVQDWKDKQMWNYKKEQRKYLENENKRRKRRNATLLTKEEIDKEVKRRTDDFILRMEKKPKKQLHKVYDNERTIRRFKTQDELLLIMAREILKAKSQDKDFTKDFCLKYVMTDSLLDKPIDFDWSVKIEKKKKNEKGIIEKEIIRKTIRQEGMKMKNYGQFYKFASDHQRLESLLSRLPQSVFQRAEIENEFSYYDTNRSEVFRQVYIIESKALELKSALKEDKNAKEEWFNYIDKKTGKSRPIRNSFIQLLEILAAGKDGILDDAEKTAMQRTRNAFGHNTYDIDLPAVFEGKEEKMKIPEIANGIKDKIEEQTDELKKRIN